MSATNDLWQHQTPTKGACNTCSSIPMQTTSTKTPPTSRRSTLRRPAAVATPPPPPPPDDTITATTQALPPPPPVVAQTTTRRRGWLLPVGAALGLLLLILIVAILYFVNRTEAKTSKGADPAALEELVQKQRERDQKAHDEAMLEQKKIADDLRKQLEEKKKTEVAPSPVPTPNVASGTPANTTPGRPAPVNSSTGTTAQEILSFHVKGGKYELCDDIVAMLMGQQARKMYADGVINVNENVLVVADQGPSLFHKTRYNTRLKQWIDQKFIATEVYSTGEPNVDTAALENYIRTKIGTPRAGQPDWVKFSRNPPANNTPPDSNGNVRR